MSVLTTEFKDFYNREYNTIATQGSYDKSMLKSIYDYTLSIINSIFKTENSSIFKRQIESYKKLSETEFQIFIYLSLYEMDVKSDKMRDFSKVLREDREAKDVLLEIKEFINN